jgi:hypothetical protein
MSKACPIMSKPIVFPNGHAQMFHTSCLAKECELYVEVETNRHDTEAQSGMKKIWMCSFAASACKNNMGRIIT